MWDLAPSHANLMSSRVGVPSNSVISSSCKANENVLHFKISPLPSFRLPFARWLHIEEEDETNRFEKEETIPSSLLLSSVDPPLSPRHFFLDQTHHGTMQRDIKTHEISRRDKIFITKSFNYSYCFFFSEKYILRKRC